MAYRYIYGKKPQGSSHEMTKFHINMYFYYMYYTKKGNNKFLPSSHEWLVSQLTPAEM